MNDDIESAVNDNTLSWQHYALVAGTCMLLWILLTGSLDRQELIAGGVVSLLVTALFTSRLVIFTGFRFSWLAPVYILSYLGNFLVALVLANFDLAVRVLSPSLPIRPEMVRVHRMMFTRLVSSLLVSPGRRPLV